MYTKVKKPCSYVRVFYPVWALLLFCVSVAFTAEVCKFKYKGTPEELHESRLKVSEKAVAMSEHIVVGTLADSITEGTNSSVFFIIDNSGSMYDSTKGHSPNDKWGSRFTVTSELIDTIYDKNPNTEVGLCFFWGCLYMYDRDDPEIMTQIDQVDPRKGAYMKLLQLNKEYDSKPLGRATGYEILKYYLQTDTLTKGLLDTYSYLNITYKPTDAVVSSSQYSGGTNISLAFDAARAAFKNAQYDPEQQFVIFFSDGEATHPKEDKTKMMEYKEGKGMPTTFTVFFDPEDTAKKNLEIMTENIKKNNYSETNPKSQLHTIETDHDKLMKLLMDNAIGTILSQINTNIPIAIDINGVDKGLNWDGKGFSFNKLFELTGPETDFNYEIKYKVKKDTLSRSSRVDFDTVTTRIDFTVVVEDGYAMPDTLEAMYWDRVIEFYHKGSKITSIEPSMDEIEVRFTATKIDTLYDYNNVKLRLTTTEGSEQDEETFSLSDKGSYHSFTFKREIGTTAKNDGTIQHRNPDTLKALFKNPDLTLDTLVVAIPCNGQNEYRVTEGTYFDTDADGHVDSIYLAISPDTKLEPLVDDIVNVIDLPDHRKFNVVNAEYHSGGIAYRVEEKRDEIETSTISGKDKLHISSSVLTESAVLLESELTFIDSMAPVVLKASLVDSVKEGSKDFLTVIFSESVTTVSEKKPFTLYAMPGEEQYSAEFSVESSSGDEVVFLVETVSGRDAINDGDSININWDVANGISDEKGNVQDHHNNRRSVIAVQKIEEGILMMDARYRDRDANGRIDEIFVAFYGEYIEENLTEIFDAITLPAWRNFSVQSHSFDKGGLLIKVEQNIDDTEINTAVTSEDVLEIKEEVTTTGDMVILKGRVTAKDEMAPIILRASVIDSIESSARDELTILFSEDVREISEDSAFLFYDKGSSDLYDVAVEQLDLTGNTACFSILDKGRIDDGDSIHINWDISECVKDLEGNEQQNSKNIKREINLKIAKNEIALTRALYHDENGDGKIDEITLLFNGENVEENMGIIVDNIALPDFRNFSKESQSFSSNRISLKVNQDIDNDEINTAVTDDDIITIREDVELSEKSRLLSFEGKAIDEVAPIIMSANYIDSVFYVFKGGDTTVTEEGIDKLIITFSEEIREVDEERPFNLLQISSDDEYDVYVEYLRKSGDKQYEFQVTAIEFADAILGGDSIWIRTDVIDLADNNQTNEDNYRRPIADTTIVTKTWLPDDVTFVLKATVLDPEEEIEFTKEYSGLDGVGTYKGVMVLTVEPEDREKADLNERDILSGELVIFDCLGNQVSSKVAMEYDKDERRLIYVWQGTNETDRKVGAGSYYAIASIRREYYTKELSEAPQVIEGKKILQSTVGVSMKR